MCGTLISMRRQATCENNPVLLSRRTLSTITDARDRYMTLAFTARFEDTSAAARGTRTAPLALRAGHLDTGLVEDSAFTLTVRTVAFARRIAIRARKSGHSNAFSCFGRFWSRLPWRSRWR
jgi:hypothetical protein